MKLNNYLYNTCTGQYLPSVDDLSSLEQFVVFIERVVTVMQ